MAFTTGSVRDSERLVQEHFENFVQHFKMKVVQGGGSTMGGSSEEGVAVYMEQLEDMRQRDQCTLHVNFTHLYAFDDGLAEALHDEYYRFEVDLRRAVQNLMQRLDASAVRTRDNTLKEYFVSFDNVHFVKKVRDLKSSMVGQLLTITGTVTRTSEVRPELLYGTFKCGMCGMHVRYLEQQFKFREPGACPNTECKNTKLWELVPDESVFVDWQRMRLQENSDEIPPGSMPRTVDVILRHSCVERAKAGDKVTLAGCPIVVPDVSQLMKQRGAPKVVRQAAGYQGSGVSGLKSLGVRELTYRLAFLGSSVTPEGANGKDPSQEDNEPEKTENRIQRVLGTMAPEQVKQVSNMSKEEDVLDKMVKSVALNVHGSTQVKRGLLLMLFGGVQKRTPEGIRLRGDINVCVVGDPSTAKSQFLKWTCKFLPRAVYTSGKASSSAGLTASVIKDPDTGEFCVEAGALMLADNSVCCIDEFDKMDPADQVAIHEAMEQQTISITKAGIQATLNARTSILAAANPVFGRYDKTKTLRQNVNISPPILSRFDLFFVVLDELDPHVDRAVAKHIVRVHRRTVDTLVGPYTEEDIANYIRVARQIDPELSPEAEEAVVRCYVRLRHADAVGSSKQSYRITVRQLESLVRLSEAVARAHLVDRVTVAHVNEAFNLLKRSLLTVDSPSVELVDAPAAVGVPNDSAAADSGSDVDMGADDSGSDRASETSSVVSSGSAAGAGAGAGAGASTVTLSHAAFQGIKTQLLFRLRELEAERDIAEDDSDAEDGSAAAPPTVTELVEWFIKQNLARLERAGDIEQQAVRFKQIVTGVIARLVDDSVLVQDDEDRLTVHSNINVDY